MGRFVFPGTSRDVTALEQAQQTSKEEQAMSDEQRNDGDEIEAHGPHYGANDEPGDEIEAHGPHYGANDEADDEVEGHMNRAG